MKRKIKIILWLVAAFIVLPYMLLLIFIEDLETFVSFPWGKVNLKEIIYHPAGIISAEEINIVSSNGRNINGLYIDKWADKTVYYFHGNGAPMEYFYTEMRYIASLGYNLMSYDFPGYGKSEWTPYKENVSRFSKEFYDHIKREKKLNDEDVIIWGYSIWTAVAVDFAQYKPFHSLVLFSPLASRYDMSEKLLWFPIQKIVWHKNSYISKELVASITMPTLIIHGNTDKVVPFSQGKQVYENSAWTPKQFIEIDRFGHSLIIERYWDVLQDSITGFLNQEPNQEEYIFLDRKKAEEILRAQ